MSPPPLWNLSLSCSILGLCYWLLYDCAEKSVHAYSIICLYFSHLILFATVLRHVQWKYWFISFQNVPLWLKWVKFDCGRDVNNLLLWCFINHLLTYLLTYLLILPRTSLGSSRRSTRLLSRQRGGTSSSLPTSLGVYDVLPSTPRNVQTIVIVIYQFFIVIVLIILASCQRAHLLIWASLPHRPIIEVVLSVNEVQGVRKGRQRTF